MSIKIEHEVVEKFRSLSLFSMCGEKYSSLSFEVKQVFDWDNATKYFCDPRWEDVTLDARNELTEFLHENFKAQYKNWNTFAGYARDFISSELVNQITSWQTDNKITEEFVDNVKWDLVNAMLFEYFRRITSATLPDFYERIFFVYAAGHFPCGWIGEYPKGKMVII